MGKLTESFRNNAMHRFLFCLSLALLCWPILSVAESDHAPFNTLIYLFVVWSLMIALLFIMGKCCRRQLQDLEERKTEEN